MTIPSVVQGLIETEDGKVFELDSPKGSAWLESIGSFRFEPSGDSKPYTVRKESGIYWYGCRKVAGKVRKKYIGKSSEVSIAKLEEIAEALETPPVPRVDKVAEVAEVAETSTDRLTALELQVANLQKALEALQEKLPGKLESGDSLELPKVDSEVAERLQNELSNLKAENKTLRHQLEQSTLQIHGYQDAEITLKETVKEAIANSSIWSDRLTKCQELLERRTKEADKSRTFFVEEQAEKEKIKADYAKLLESSTAVTNKLREEVAQLRSQLATERADREEVEIQLSDLRQKSVTASELPEAADLLNQLKGRRKKSRADLADINAILGLLSDENGSNPL